MDADGLGGNAVTSQPKWVVFLTTEDTEDKENSFIPARTSGRCLVGFLTANGRE